MPVSKKTSQGFIVPSRAPASSGYTRRKNARRQIMSSRGHSSKNWRSVSSTSARRKNARSQFARSKVALKRGQYLFDLANKPQTHHRVFHYHTA